ncbi:hypothetical protein [Nocardia sp. NPDC049707]|uniref:hypothetical protein n=1 Tax=Nocardia sp. NPDC049707 TaxID=3154735 RepID=UPI0034499301
MRHLQGVSDHAGRSGPVGLAEHAGIERQGSCQLTDAMLCANGLVTTLVRLSPTPEHRHGHGALYDGLTASGIDGDRVRTAVAAALPPPRDDHGRITLAALRNTRLSDPLHRR